MENQNDVGKKTSWWEKKSKAEKRTFIIEACVWTVGIVLLTLVLFSKEFFGEDFFGNSTDGFQSIGAWFVAEKDAFIKTAIGIVVACPKDGQGSVCHFGYRSSRRLLSKENGK